jgi:hypothetical protein
MNKLDKKVFGKQMQILLAFFGKEFEDEVKITVLDAYYNHLCSVENAQLVSGVRTAIATLKFFPTAKDLKELCYGMSDELRAYEYNSINIEQKQLPGYDDTEDCRLARENLNLLADCLKEGISQEVINNHLRAKKPLRSLLKEVRERKQVQIDLAEFPEVFSNAWGSEQRAATAADYQAIAKRTLELWKQGE